MPAVAAVVFASVAILTVVILWGAFQGLAHRFSAVQSTPVVAAPVETATPIDPSLSAQAATLALDQPTAQEKPLSLRTYRFQPAHEYVYEFLGGEGPSTSWAKGRLVYSLRRSPIDDSLELEYRADWGPAGSQQTRGTLRTTRSGTWLSNPAADEAPLVVRVGGLAIEPLAADDALQWEATQLGAMQPTNGARLLPKLFDMASQPSAAATYQERKKYVVVRETSELIAIDCDYALHSSPNSRNPVIVGVGSCEFDKRLGLVRKGAMSFTLANNRVTQHRFELQQVVQIAVSQPAAN